MKSVTAPTLSIITNDYHNAVGLVVEAEWKHNKFHNTKVDNTPAEDTDGYDIEMFPISSITLPNRPISGINKAVVGQASVDEEYHDDVPAARYYIASVEDEYKYWQSPLSAGAGPGFAMTNCAPQVLYYADDGTTPIVVKANKIHFTFERTWAYPTAYTVQVKSSTGGSWTTVSTSPTIPSDGKVELWWNNSAWTTTKNTSGTPQDVHGVRLVVTAMNKAAYMNLIELGVALNLSLTSDVISMDSEFTMGEKDFITPLGQISSNSASLVLSNDLETYSDSNPSSQLFGLIDKGVEFTCWTNYSGELIREFTMISDTWQEDGEGSVTVNLVDNSRILQEAKPRAVLYSNIPVHEAVWRICDQVGFTNYEVSSIDLSPHAIIDKFWTDGDKTAWEIFSELSRASQTAIYFDAYGKLQVKTREKAFEDTTEVFTFRRDTIPGSTPANIVSFSENNDYEANKVNINWKPTGYSEQRDNIVPFEVVWEPEGDVVLRASELRQDITSLSTAIILAPADAATWPFKGLCQIEGEWIEYEGKQYYYYTGSTRNTAVVKSQAEKERLDAITGPFFRHMNSFSGRLMIKTRGLYNTDIQNHYYGLTGWTTTRRAGYSTNTTPAAAGIVQNRSASSVTIANVTTSFNDYTHLHRGSSGDAGYKRLGTRMRIDRDSRAHKTAGIMFNGSTSVASGYYVEVTPTVTLDAGMRTYKNEICFYAMKADGSKLLVGGTNNHGSEIAIVQGTFVDIDIYYQSGTDDQITIWANGKMLFTATVTNASGFKQASGGKFSLYSRGDSSATFDYVYAINSLGNIPLDDYSYLDRIEGAFRGDQWLDDWVYETKYVNRKVKGVWTKQKIKYQQRFFDEFGPIVHEIRKFDVKFTNDKPCIQSKLYFSNTSQVVAMEYWSDPKNAHFYLANRSRQNAVVNGDDTLTAGGNTINHKLFVYGRPVIQKDEQKITKRDEYAIRRRGVIEIDYSSDWIQNEAEANSLADWLVENWTRADAELELEVFGNPLLEISDPVRVIFNDINAKYWVVGIQNSWDSGLSTVVTLRKMNA